MNQNTDTEKEMRERNLLGIWILVVLTTAIGVSVKGYFETKDPIFLLACGLAVGGGLVGVAAEFALRKWQWIVNEYKLICDKQLKLITELHDFIDELEASHPSPTRKDEAR